MRALLLLAALSAAEPSPSDLPPASARYEVSAASTIAAVGRNVRGLVENLHAAASRRAELLKSKDPSAAKAVAELESRYRADRAALLEQVALLQDWVLRAKDPRSASPFVERRVKPEGRKALGRRKVRASDFQDAAKASDLPFAP